MKISSKQVPAGSQITVNNDPVLSSIGIIKLSPKITTIFARWSALEQRLEHLHALITDANVSAKNFFDGERGWDRRFKAICGAAVQKAPELSDLVRAVLRIIEIPAQKRHELAHATWGTTEGYAECLTLVSGNIQFQSASDVVRAKIMRTAQIEIDHSALITENVLVYEADLDLAIEEIKIAYTRLEALIYGHFYPQFIDAQGNGFSDYRKALADDVEIMKLQEEIKRDRRRSEKNKRRIDADSIG